LETIEADGGDDGPEDVAGGFKKALEQDWRAKSRYAVLIADAPCHGRKYHTFHDNYP
jgi:myosin protein heavy chain